jgi:hypothetical protein
MGRQLSDEADLIRLRDQDHPTIIIPHRTD